MVLRYPLGVLFGLAFSLVLFWLMWHLVSVPIDIGEMRQATRVEFTRMRQARDATLAAPTLLLPSIQVNIRAGKFPPAEANGVHYLKIPVKIRSAA